MKSLHMRWITLARRMSCKSNIFNHNTALGRRTTQNAAKILDINDTKSIAIASECLQQSGIIALPTDTVYGLACNANDMEAVQKLYAIKGREQEKPVAICVADLKTFKLYGQAEHLSDDLLNCLLPGPITIVLKKSKNLNNPYLNSNSSKIGIRIPKLKLIEDLCKHFKQPLALTSANKSKQKSSLHILEFQELWSNLDMVLDGGLLGLSEHCRLASTVVDMSTPGKYKIIREGVAMENTVRVLNMFNFSLIKT